MTIDYPENPIVGDRQTSTKVPKERPALWAEGPTSGAMGLSVNSVVPAHLLDGGEVVIFAIKPSPWFVLLTSLRWIILGVLVAILAERDVLPTITRWYLFQGAFWLVIARLAWATLDWVSRLYVLTNRRVMRIRGVFEVDLFECPLERIQNTAATFSLGERILRVGTISFQTAGATGMASWRMVSKPLEIHQKLREAIQRSKNRGNNGL